MKPIRFCEPFIVPYPEDYHDVWDALEERYWQKEGEDYIGSIYCIEMRYNFALIDDRTLCREVVINEENLRGVKEDPEAADEIAAFIGCGSDVIKPYFIQDANGNWWNVDSEMVYKRAVSILDNSKID